MLIVRDLSYNYKGTHFCAKSFLVSFFFLKKQLPIVVVRDVCLSVRLSYVEIISFRGNLISKRPIDLSDRPECPLGGSACPKIVIF